MQNKARKIKNPWKLAFFILIGIIVGTLCYLFIKITALPTTDETFENSLTVSSESVFQLALTKAQTNQLIQYYLTGHQADSTIKYKFVLDNQALLTADFTFWGMDLNFNLFLEPSVTEEGDVLLKAKNLSIGSFSLPISEVMQYFMNTYPLPTWVEVDPENERILLHTNQYKLSNGMYFTVEEINLEEDRILISAYLPETSSE